ncbi:MAG: MBL fold metallo-hydrolase [Thermomicrobia bacterium]|nr:MBL fold metallo-hydrolase [Thermomicrobia bacterium]
MIAERENKRSLSQEWFTTWAVAPGVICFAEDQHEQEVRSYLIIGAERSLLWDAGMGVADIKREVERFVAVRPETLMMVCSHSHFDHVGDVWRFAEAGVPIYAHPAEAERIARGLSAAQCAHWLQPDSLLGPLPTGFDPGTYAIRPAPVTHLLDEGGVLDLGDRQFAVLHMPGHSPGGLCLWDTANGLLLSGDTAYSAPLYAYSLDAEPDVYRRSLRRLAALAPHVRTVLPSHDETPMPPELLVAMADAFDRIHDGDTADVLVTRDDEGKLVRPYDLYDFGPFQVRMRAGWGGEG